MPTTSAILTFAALAFVLIIVPGPSVMFVISRGVALGRRAALETVLGNAAGIYLQVAFVAVGLGAVIERSSALYSTLKFAGAAYLVYLGVQSIRHRKATAAEAASISETAGPSRSAAVDGFIVGVANPKSIVFFAALLPQFADPNGAPAGVQMMVLGLVFVLIALVLDSLWAIAAGTAREWFAGRPVRLERLGVVGGTSMIGLGVLLATTGRSE